MSILPWLTASISPVWPACSSEGGGHGQRETRPADLGKHSGGFIWASNQRLLKAEMVHLSAELHFRLQPLGVTLLSQTCPARSVMGETSLSNVIERAAVSRFIGGENLSWIQCGKNMLLLYRFIIIHYLLKKGSKAKLQPDQCVCSPTVFSSALK